MSRKDAVLLVSRALALYLGCWTFSELTYVPTSLYALSHHLSQRSVLAAGDYFTDSDVLSLALRIFRIVTLCIIALWLYKCGKDTQSFFWRNADSGDPTVQSTELQNNP